MSKADRIAGSCLCGSVRFTAIPAKAEMGVCHCGMCRRWSGGVFMAVDCGASVEFESGSEPGIFRSSDWGERGFCRDCGSTLFWRAVDGSTTVVSIQAFEQPERFAFTSEIFIDSKPANYEFANSTHKMTAAEVYAAFAPKDSA